MVYNEIEIMIGGPQGSGLETTSQVLTSSLAYLGYGVFSDREYYSNITGKHSYIHMKISSYEIPFELSYPVKLLAAMDEETIFVHFQDLDDKGIIIYNKNILKRRLDPLVTMEGYTKDRIREKFRELGLNGTIESIIQYLSREKDITIVELEYKKYLDKLSERYSLTHSQVKRYTSSIPIGAISGLMDIDRDAVESGLRRRFFEREKLVEHNLFLYDIVHREINEQFGTPLKMGKSKIKEKEFLVASGNDVVALAKIVGGVRYQSYYPITPAADESFVLESYENILKDDSSTVVVFQTEDEIAAITSAIGASLTGVRTATATSGPGFSLMVEGLGWAGNNEVPVVITYYQRGGPATGLPTRGSQSDLLFTLFASHGEFPRIVLASGDHREAFLDTIESFNLAEKYQVPVIHLLDKFIANAMVTMEIPDIDNLSIERGKMVSGEKGYKRFDLSEDISPRAPLGSNVVIWHTGNEHDEYGHNVEDPILRTKMYAKRMGKMDIMRKEIPDEFKVKYFGEKNPDFIVVGWGFVKNVALKTLKILEGEGINGGYLHLRMFSPFPTKSVERVFGGLDANRIIAVEHNYTVQAAEVISMNTGIKIDQSILKYSGRPIYTGELKQAIKEIINNKIRKVVLTYGS